MNKLMEIKYLNSKRTYCNVTLGERSPIIRTEEEKNYYNKNCGRKKYCNKNCGKKKYCNKNFGRKNTII